MENLQTTELRIGNLVFDKKRNRIVTVWGIESNHDKIVVNYANGSGVYSIDLKHIESIQLTEEILLKFGFEKYDWFDGCFIKCNNKHLMIQFYEPKQEILIYFTKISKDKDGHKMNGRDYLFKLKKYYVHQLQNLYFTLIDKELEYNKNKP